MSGNKSKPSKTGAEKASVPEKEAETKEVKETKSDFSSKVAKYMNKSANKKKRSVDPIIAVSATILIICCAVVIGYTIYDKCFADHTQPNVEYGDTVNVEYVGSFYIYYDEDGSVIFDTNIEDVANNANYKFSYEWSKSEKYDLLQVTVGSGGSLSMFEDALIGHHPGETVKVCIPAGEGYKLKGGYHQSNIADIDQNTIDIERVFDNADAFKTFFGSEPLEGGYNTIQSPYGWNAVYSKNGDGTYLVKYQLTESDEGKEFSVDGSDVKYKVIDVTSGSVYYNLVFTWNGQMLKTFDLYGNTIYITSYYAMDGSGRHAGDYDYKIKTADNPNDGDTEVSGETLYFVIKIVEYTNPE